MYHFIFYQDLPAPKCHGFQTSTPTVKYERKKKGLHAPFHANESKALQNWQAKMLERKKQQGYISSE